jgi:hypothetical protein
MKRILSLALSIFLFITIAACQGADFSAAPTPDMSFYAVDPVFREFYNLLGGKVILGDAISDIYKSGGKQYQYTINGLMIYDPLAPPKQFFQLASLGRRLGIGGPTSPDVGVAEAFRPMYDKLSGTFVGQPLTGLVYNGAQNRYEQYFENIGFYHGGESTGDVRLLPYGAWICHAECRSIQPRNSILEFPSPTPASTSGSPTQTTPPKHEWSLLVQESFPLIAPDHSQQIEVEIQINDAPLVGDILELVLYLPEGTQKALPFPPTDRDGKTRLTIPPFGAPGGTLVPYKVCVTSQSGDAYCMRGSYLIWNEP